MVKASDMFGVSDEKYKEILDEFAKDIHKTNKLSELSKKYNFKRFGEDGLRIFLFGRAVQINEKQ